MARTCAIYARISVSSEESVSIDRQIEAAEQYAAARGWQVASVFRDDGVSASLHKPEARPGWRALLDSPEEFSCVVVWKVDRLARRVIDFLNADAALQQRGAGIVAVEQTIDMTTPDGRGFATMLAVFGEMEAAAISARVKAARDHLVKNGRVVGGALPYGWRSVKNPDGAGLVLAHDPERIGYVQEMAQRVLAGESVYAVQQWLTEAGAPTPSAKAAGWAYSSVERILRNPVLAGMTAYNPGNATKVRGTEVLRGDDGLPVVDESTAIMSTSEWRRLLALLDDRTSPQARPRASKAVTTPLLSRLAYCGECNRFMQRGTTSGRPCLKCPTCHQTISRTQLEEHLESRLLTERGNQRLLTWTQETRNVGPELSRIESAIQDVTEAMGRDDADMVALAQRLTALKEDRATLRTADGTSGGQVLRWTGATVAQAWAASDDDLDRREVLAGQIDRLEIVRGKTGRRLDPARVVIAWMPEPVELEPGVLIAGPTLAELAHR